MKKLFLLPTLLLFLLNDHADACCHAFQDRYLPVGSINNELLVFHAPLTRKCDLRKMSRSKRVTDLPMQWKGVFTLKKITPTDTQIVAVLDTVYFMGDVYLETLQSYYDRAKKVAADMEGFQSFGQVLLSYRDETPLRFNGANAFVDTLNNKRYVLREMDEDEIESSEVYFYPDLSMVRMFNTGGQEYWIVTISDRQNHVDGTDETKRKNKQACIKGLAFDPGVTWHSISRDLIYKVGPAEDIPQITKDGIEQYSRQ